jgi:ATP-binding cassette subfamily B protein
MEHGKLVEQGRHEELLEQQGIYASLWRVQSGVASSYTVISDSV